MRGLEARILFAKGIVAEKIFGHDSDESTDLFDRCLSAAYVEGYADFALGFARAEVPALIEDVHGFPAAWQEGWDAAFESFVEIEERLAQCEYDDYEYE